MSCNFGACAALRGNHTPTLISFLLSLRLSSGYYVCLLIICLTIFSHTLVMLNFWQKASFNSQTIVKINKFRIFEYILQQY